MQRDTDFIYEAITKVEELTGITIEFDSTRPNYDGLIRIKETEFAVEAKSAVRTSNLGLILSQLELLTQVSRRPILMVSKYIAKAAAKEFKERSINFIDTAGNALIKQGDLFIYIEGRKAATKEKTNQSRAFQEAGLKIIFTLLTSPQSLQLSYRGIAEASGVSIGSLSNVMNELEYLNFILRTNDRRILKNQNELVERWVVAYNDVLRPRIFRRRMRFIQPESNQHWQSIDLTELKNPICWGGEPGAALLETNLRPEKFTIYTNSELPELARTLKLVPDPNGNVEILKQFWISDKNTPHIAPPLLIYTDLINSSSGRNIEIAKHILENELQNIQ